MQTASSRPEPEAFMYHWIKTLERLGRNDTSVVSDHPFANVFVKDGERTHASYNFGSEPLAMTFSHGVRLQVPPKEMAVHKGK